MTLLAQLSSSACMQSPGAACCRAGITLGMFAPILTLWCRLGGAVGGTTSCSVSCQNAHPAFCKYVLFMAYDAPLFGV